MRDALSRMIATSVARFAGWSGGGARDGEFRGVAGGNSGALRQQLEHPVADALVEQQLDTQLDSHRAAHIARSGEDLSGRPEAAQQAPALLRPASLIRTHRYLQRHYYRCPERINAAVVQ
jgi:hypothetical protein